MLVEPTGRSRRCRRAPPTANSTGAPGRPSVSTVSVSVVGAATATGSSAVAGAGESTVSEAATSMRMRAWCPLAGSRTLCARSPWVAPAPGQPRAQAVAHRGPVLGGDAEQDRVPDGAVVPPLVAAQRALVPR